MRFIAMASVSCASLLMEPYDMAPVTKRVTMFRAGSTSSSGTLLVPFLNSIKPRILTSPLLWSFTSRVNSLKLAASD